MFEKYKYHFWLHIVVLIFGLTGILGKLISANSYLLVWYRVLIGVAAIAIYFLISKHSFKINKKILKQTFMVGCLIAIHWVAFFEAIKQSTVSIALVCLSSSTLFTALIEPLYFKRKIKGYELFLGLLIIVGLVLIFNFEFNYLTGIILGIVAAVFSSWFTVINGVLVKETNSKTLSFYELLGALVILSSYLIFMNLGNMEAFLIPVSDIKWLLILGIICTAFAFIMSVEVMKKISPFTVVISINLEPIYSIIIAVLLWPESEIMSTGFYVGMAIVLSAIFLNAFFKFRDDKKAKSVIGKVIE
ncbi:MAG: DMT family transporter [Flavobacteriales bacterium]|nr:DMT family transporter [Flavobacteriales bacterium]MCW8912530.1 DMT family transporter [Flavobacteriales bacterium]MCW8937560.1 DMT family transporter [Flavobacteriales bacterium]MCW8939601.1 DMT family transporter [Flavobacteriales bacterium]MCW8968783.1 DMT family transporter [Flavobacteriales bacterium]